MQIKLDIKHRNFIRHLETLSLLFDLRYPSTMSEKKGREFTKRIDKFLADKLLIEGYVFHPGRTNNNLPLWTLVSPGRRKASHPLPNIPDATRPVLTSHDNLFTDSEFSATTFTKMPFGVGSTRPQNLFAQGTPLVYISKCTMFLIMKALIVNKLISAKVWSTCA
jgi:hypothetical protein